jgi:hypothetical protein
MRWLLFLSRLAFICGFFFLLSISLLIKNWAGDAGLAATIIIIGYVMGAIIVPVTNICYLVVWVLRKKLRTIVPLWLIIANVLFLFVLLYYLSYINDHQHN